MKSRNRTNLAALLICAGTLFACTTEPSEAQKSTAQLLAQAAADNAVAQQQLQESQALVAEMEAKLATLTAKTGSAADRAMRLRSSLFTVWASDPDTDPGAHVSHPVCNAIAAQRIDTTVVLNTSDARCSFTQRDVKRRNLVAKPFGEESTAFVVSRVSNFVRGDVATTAFVVNMGEYADKVHTVREVVDSIK